ncbi:MAG: DUF374 domain-containing protein [Bdellovibrio sp.]|nr:MAG: DUF374 domain-containing protein [Bdellovibrio sp.]
MKHSKVFHYLVWLFYRLLSWSWRITVEEHPFVSKLLKEKRPIILAHWHGDELALIHLVKPYKLATMTSQSQDGEIVNFVINKLGGATSRGSTSKAGVSGLLGLVRLIQKGQTASIALDGPRGPYHEIKPGVFELSRLTGAYIVPVGVSCSHFFLFKRSWNKAYLPYPFTKVHIVFDNPLSPIEKHQDPKDPHLKEVLKSKLNDAKRKSKT